MIRVEILIHSRLKGQILDDQYRFESGYRQNGSTSSLTVHTQDGSLELLPDDFVYLINGSPRQQSKAMIRGEWLHLLDPMSARWTEYNPAMWHGTFRFVNTLPTVTH